MLENINITLSEKLKVREWKTTESVTNWFKNLPRTSIYQ